MTGWVIEECCVPVLVLCFVALTYAKNANKKKIDDKVSARPTTLVTASVCMGCTLLLATNWTIILCDINGVINSSYLRPKSKLIAYLKERLAIKAAMDGINKLHNLSDYIKTLVSVMSLKIEIKVYYRLYIRQTITCSTTFTKW